MNNNPVAILFYGQALCSLLIIANFAAWFLLRETRRGDQACSLVATLCFVVLFLSLWTAGRHRSFGLISSGPGFVAFFWFMALKGRRGRRRRIRQWSRQHGYKLIAVESQPTANPRRGSLRSRAETRITVRRLSDGQYLVGWVFDDGFHFDVAWDALPTGHVGDGLHEPNPPHVGPPGPSKE